MIRSANAWSATVKTSCRWAACSGRRRCACRRERLLANDADHHSAQTKKKAIRSRVAFFFELFVMVGATGFEFASLPLNTYVVLSLLQQTVM